MKTIYKYPLKIVDEQILRVPFGSRIMSSTFQGDTLCVWALVDKDEELLTDYTIYVHGTGHNLINPLSHFIDTVSIGSVVFHIFAEIKK